MTTHWLETADGGYVNFDMISVLKPEKSGWGPPADEWQVKAVCSYGIVETLTAGPFGSRGEATAFIRLMIFNLRENDNG